MQQEFTSNLQAQLHQLVFATSTDKIKTITLILNEKFYSTKDCVASLVEIASVAPEWQVRQLAAVELKKRIPKYWSELDESLQVSIKDHLLKQILIETETLSKNCLARVISRIAQIDVPNNAWPNLFDFLYDCCNKPIVSQREIGIFVFDSLLETTSNNLLDQFSNLIQLFRKLINDQESIQVRVTTIEAIGKLGEWIETDNRADIAVFQELVPPMVQVLEACLAFGDEDNASRCFEVFNVLLLLEAPLLNKHLAQIIEFSLNVGSNKKLDDNLRIMALNFLVWTTTYKRTRLLKLKIVGNLIERLMIITTEPDPEDIDDDSPSRVALRTLNLLSTNLPPTQVFPTIAENVVHYMQSDDPLVRKGGMLTMAISIEGSVDFVRSKVGELVHLVTIGLSDQDKRVQRASCMALGCLAEELSEEISQFHEQLIPQILNILTSNPNAEISKHACNALDAILEDLGPRILPYLPQVMHQLIQLLDNGPAAVKPMALASIGSAVYSANEASAPYIKDIMQRIGQAMSLTESDDAISLRGVATDTAGTLAEVMGEEQFRPYLQDTITLAFKGMSMGISTLRDCEFNVNTAISEEKEIACDCAAELFRYTRSNFLPYLTDVLNEIIKLLLHYSDTVRKSAVSALFSILFTVITMAPENSSEAGLSGKAPVHENVITMIKLIMPAILEMWEEEDEPVVVTKILVELGNTMFVGGRVIIDDYLGTISVNLQQILTKQALCQLPDEDYDETDLDSDELSEYDSLLISAAGDTVAGIAKTLESDFAPQLTIFLPILLNYYKPTCATNERSMCIGSLSEIVKYMGPSIAPYAETLYQLYLSGMSDPEPEVKSNSAFGMGLLVQNVKIDWSTQLPIIFRGLAQLFELNTNSSNMLDNACGSISRIILALPDHIPYAEVLPVWLSHLPIKTDHEEDVPVYDAFCKLLEINNQAIQAHAETIKSIIKMALQDVLTIMSHEARQKLSEVI
ncbi:hypothetical protein BB561_005860 [Smittium simulii]|uniref:Importin N-terminal domain-containing protein n=1 Tax=Smittium simulii TaxID=133385 RepID=A0A2T9Y7V7_9FUNG|nr:hypothetical protein BB561_005860 [Smittium simulii]